MPKRRIAQVKIVVLVAAAALIIVGIALVAVPPFRALFGFSLGGATADAAAKETAPAAQLIYDANKKPGLQLAKLAVDGLGIKPVVAEQAVQPRALPPQIGTINFDNETLFSIPSRFAGEIAYLRQVPDDTSDRDQPTAVKEKPRIRRKGRPLHYGDRVKQGELLCVVHSTVLGTAKATLVDAVCSLALSTETLERHQKLFEEGSIGLAQLRLSERQKLQDSNSVLTAERTLLTLRLTEPEVQEVKDEAKKIADLAKDAKFQSQRDAKEEAEKWARVEIRVPWFDRSNPDRELTVVEKNTNIYSMVDPINTNLPLFRLADMTRLQVWVHPPEEYLPVFQRMLESSGAKGSTWYIDIPAYSEKLPATRFTQIAPSLEPNQHSPMLMGYLKNPAGKKYIVGQFVTATLFLDPEPNTVEIPTDALNEVNGETLVFVQPDATKDQFFLRRVAVIQRFKDKTFVRMQLTGEEINQSEQFVKSGKRPLEPLLPGDRVVTQGVVELTAALEDLLSKKAEK